MAPKLRIPNPAVSRQLPRGKPSTPSASRGHMKKKRVMARTALLPTHRPSDRPTDRRTDRLGLKFLTEWRWTRESALGPGYNVPVWMGYHAWMRRKEERIIAGPARRGSRLVSAAPDKGQLAVNVVVGTDGANRGPKNGEWA
ncbi:unnamed protein product [Protopolystoma xenopodis]|uniref:Uncharacterized protein n=1 Tax=Protopolystoma xenopodis TaxID=117903 RepID=A0A3S5C4D6_9PLAT|nr:unnamed protein product [Protopolystoma xenopodis]